MKRCLFVLVALGFAALLISCDSNDNGGGGGVNEGTTTTTTSGFKLKGVWRIDIGMPPPTCGIAGNTARNVKGWIRFGANNQVVGTPSFNLRFLWGNRPSWPANFDLLIINNSPVTLSKSGVLTTDMLIDITSATAHYPGYTTISEQVHLELGTVKMKFVSQDQITGVCTAGRLWAQNITPVGVACLWGPGTFRITLTRK